MRETYLFKRPAQLKLVVLGENKLCSWKWTTKMNVLNHGMAIIGHNKAITAAVPQYNLHVLIMQIQIPGSIMAAQ